MEVLSDQADVPSAGAGTVVTIGAYDGVHRGHQAVIARVRGLAAERGWTTTVVTFDRHPAMVVRPESAPRLLTDLDQKLELLAATGIDRVLVIRFDETRSREPAEDFVDNVLVGTLGARVVVVGGDFHFGRGRGGNVELLRRMGPGYGFDVVGMGLVEVPGAAGPVSSTAIRTLLSQGDVAGAADLLGRCHEVRGVVQVGDRRGRALLGYPTANLDVPPEICLPADGIYAGHYVTPDGHSHPAAVSVGRRPTFYADAATSLLEAHLLDFDGDLYGQPARVRFVRRLRGEERFDSVEALVAQMGHDVEATRAALA